MDQKKNNRKKYAVNTLLIMSVFYMLCHLPLFIYLFVGAVNILQASFNLSNFVSTYQISNLLLFVAISNNGFNAAILIVRSKYILAFFKSYTFC